MIIMASTIIIIILITKLVQKMRVIVMMAINVIFIP